MKKIKTGGPAYARPCSVDRRLHTVIPEQDGMTLRDYFAIHASERDVEQFTSMLGGNLTRAKARYTFADAMLTAREATDE